MARMRGMENHNCVDCALKRKIVCTVDMDDIKAYESIMTGINTADIAVNPSFIEDGLSDDKMKIFIQTVLERKEQWKNLEVDWWRNMLKKYKITNNTKIDVFNGQFYVCLDDEGIERIEFQPKVKVELVKEEVNKTHGE
jgi:uncharacterized protein YlzI (FlbEa/FlbD family)